MEKWFEHWNEYFEHLYENWQYLEDGVKQEHLNALKKSSEQVLDNYVLMDEKITLLEEKKHKKMVVTNFRSQGISYYNLNMFEKAVEELEKEWKGNKQPIFLLYLSFAYLYTQSYDKAKESFIYLLHANYEDKRFQHFAYVGLGCISVQLENFEEAITHFDKSLRLTMNEDVLYNLGICYYLQQQPEIAIEYFEKVLTYLPDDGESYYFQGCCYEQMGENSKAYESWFCGLQVAETRELLLTMAYKFEEMGLFITALHCYKRLESLGNRDVTIYHGLAWNLGLIDDREKSKQLFTFLLEKNGTNVNLWISYLWLLRNWNEEENFNENYKLFQKKIGTHPLVEQLVATSPLQ